MNINVQTSRHEMYVLCIKISAYFGIESVENLVANRRNRCINRHGVIYVKCCADWSVCLSVFLSIAFVQFLFAKFIHLCCVRLPYTMMK